MRNVLVHLCLLALGIAAALGWAGLVCLNSGEPDFTEQFWFYGLVALLVSFASFATSTLSLFDEEEA
jgi:hypothetical protein